MPHAKDNKQQESTGQAFDIAQRFNMQPLVPGAPVILSDQALAPLSVYLA